MRGLTCRSDIHQASILRSLDQTEVSSILCSLQPLRRSSRCSEGLTLAMIIDRFYILHLGLSSSLSLQVTSAALCSLSLRNCTVHTNPYSIPLSGCTVRVTPCSPLQNDCIARPAFCSPPRRGHTFPVAPCTPFLYDCIAPTAPCFLRRHDHSAMSILSWPLHCA